MQSKTVTITFFILITIGVILTQSESPTPVQLLAAEQHEEPLQITADIVINVDGPLTAVDTRVLGTNLPLWLGTSRTENSTFLARADAANLTVVRIPGGSRSNGYNWLACETGVDIDGNGGTCITWPWGLRPTEFINFLRENGAQGMYTANLNGTAKEAAAAVAFFNGSVTDNTVIGIDVRGRDWKTVAHWAQLRSDNGNPDPINIKYWEIGNEIYGGKPGLGKDCLSWGWENVWTCDGTEYVNGIGSGANRKEGFIEFRNAMRAVDPTIMVGAVGVSPQDGWSNWGNEVIAAAGDVMDFYIIHYYGYFNVPANRQVALAQPQTVWGPMMADVENAFDQHAGGRRVPIAITEYNLFSVQDQDTGRWMKQAVNMLYMADTIGQMMTNGFSIANQWNLSNGEATNGTDYGMLHDTTFARHPQYYVFPLWSKFGSQMVPVTSSYDAATTLSIYAGKLDPWTASVMVINKTGSPISASIEFAGAPDFLLNGTVDVVQSTSLDSTSVTYNGVSNPSNDLSNAPSSDMGVLSNPMTRSYPPYSVTFMEIELEEFLPTDWIYLPMAIR